MARKRAVVKQRAMNENNELHKYLFQPASGYFGIDTTIIDRVKDRYDALKRHPRISRGDILRLDQHVEFLFGIERKLQVASSLPAPPPSPNVDSASPLARGQKNCI